MWKILQTRCFFFGMWHLRQSIVLGRRARVAVSTRTGKMTLRSSGLNSGIAVHTLVHRIQNYPERSNLSEITFFELPGLGERYGVPALADFPFEAVRTARNRSVTSNGFIRIVTKLVSI